MPSVPLPPDIAEAIGEIDRDRRHGASWLAHRSAEILAVICSPDGRPVSASYSAQLAVARSAAQSLARSRPSMAAIANTVARIGEALYLSLPSEKETESSARLEQAHRRAIEVRDSWSSAAGAIFEHVRPLLGATLYTHSRSGTAESVVTRLAEERGTSRLTVIASQSHPGDEGIGLATTLAEGGIRVVLVSDGACGLFVRDADAVVIGADSVSASAGVVNKIGSFPLALAAREAHVPVYVLSETLKIAASEWEPTFEEMEVQELLPAPVPGVTVRNTYFDLTPHTLVTKIITEQGILTPADIDTIARQASISLALLDA
jgi:translation initiation factor 2B subunit (eIF-2B alpha/beta/delta family)